MATKPEAAGNTALSPAADAASAGRIHDVSAVFIHGFLDEGGLWQPVMDRGYRRRSPHC